MKIDRKKFFDSVRKSIFGNKLTFSQVRGMLLILDRFEKLMLTDTRWLAYMLATVYHETATRMQPIKEFGSHEYLDKYDTGKLAKALGNTPEDDDDGQLYCGRGFVQITGRDNYERFTNKLGIDLVGNPDLALYTDNAFSIMLIGMTEGLFTGKKLSDYFNENSDDWFNARRIINGTDKASRIADIGEEFLDALFEIPTTKTT